MKLDSMTLSKSNQSCAQSIDINKRQLLCFVTTEACFSFEAKCLESDWTECLSKKWKFTFLTLFLSFESLSNELTMLFLMFVVCVCVFIFPLLRFNKMRLGTHQLNGLWFLFISFFIDQLDLLHYLRSADTFLR